jgi:hypothetical protein
LRVPAAEQLHGLRLDQLFDFVGNFARWRLFNNLHLDIGREAAGNKGADKD